MKVIIVSGGIGSGKSTITAMLKELGAHVIDWDVLAREVVRPGLKAWQDIVEFFGRDILHEDQTINRQKLAEVVFGDEEKLGKLINADFSHQLSNGSNPLLFLVFKFISAHFLDVFGII